MRTFNSGATRDDDADKLDYEGFLSPLVLKRYAEYLNQHRVQVDGGLRESDNWQKGMPLATYMKSAWRHFMDLWHHHRGWPCQADKEEAACAVLFNVMGYLHETLRSSTAIAGSTVGVIPEIRGFRPVQQGELHIHTGLGTPICSDCAHSSTKGGVCIHAEGEIANPTCFTTTGETA
jgi:hypothetical protein